MESDRTALRPCPVDVFGYLDYRQFLSDLYAAKKGNGFSYRAFARAAKLGAPNYLQLVMTGKRNLTPAMAQRFAYAASLRGEAAAFFERLVEFNQASTLETKEAAYARLTAFARYRSAHKLECAHAAYHSKWFIPAIRELCASAAFVADPKWIAAALVPAITPEEAARALEVLLELGMLERTGDGTLHQSAAVVSTGPQTQGMHIKRYHAEMMRRATVAMDLVAAADRDISSLTLCLGPNGIERLKRRLQEFRRELLELTENDERRDRVVQVNLQLFPLSAGATSRERPRRKAAAG